MALRGGRIEGATEGTFSAINDSLRIDARLVQEDIAGSIAWAAALERANVIDAAEASRIIDGLESIAEEAAHDPDAVRSGGEEDVHSWVEARLIERIGEPGKKLHTGRSRNDQVATDLRLWLRRELDGRRREILALQSALLRLARRELETVLPGFTHLQRAQPVLFAHWCLAYVEMLERDLGRFGDARQRANECPLGCGALAGTAYPIDRERLARDLGFGAPCANSLDAVSDRDFAVEALAAAAICGMHLSRLAEDLVFYTTSEAGFIELDDSVTSSSSLMPQKKNPDALELVRGKAGRLFGALVALLTTLKGLPLAYNKDLQEDKEPLFDAMDSLALSLQVLPVVLDRARTNRAVCERAAAGGYANATDLADALVAKGVPFRDAHERTGRLVREAIRRGVALEALPIDAMRAIAPEIGPEVLTRLTVAAGLAQRDALGGTSPARVEEALDAASRRLAAASAIEHAAAEVE